MLHFGQSSSSVNSVYHWGTECFQGSRSWKPTRSAASRSSQPIQPYRWKPPQRTAAHLGPAGMTVTGFFRNTIYATVQYRYPEKIAARVPTRRAGTIAVPC